MRNSTAVIGVLLSVLTLWGFYGCASYPTNLRYATYRMVVTSDARVAKHCRKIVKTTDAGRPLDYDPPACFVPSKGGRLPTIYIGKSYILWAWDHELCHRDNPYDPTFCDGIGYPKNWGR